MTSGHNLPTFPGTFFFFSLSPIWTNVTAAGDACIGRGGDGFYNTIVHCMRQLWFQGSDVVQPKRYPFSTRHLI